MNRALVLVPLLLLVLVGLFFVLRPDSPPDAPAEEPQERTFDLAIQEDALDPGEITVDEGDQVILLLTSDNPVEFHLHGYDLEEEVGPGEPAELSFDATITGRFEIENHDTEAVLGELIVRPR
jgi:hypothetical protein